MHKIVAVRYGINGELEMFKLDDGTVLNYAECADAIKQGLLRGYNVGKDRLGEDSIKSNRDGDPTNNVIQFTTEGQTAIDICKYINSR